MVWRTEFLVLENSTLTYLSTFYLGFLGIQWLRDPIAQSNFSCFIGKTRNYISFHCAACSFSKDGFLLVMLVNWSFQGWREEQRWWLHTGCWGMFTHYQCCGGWNKEENISSELFSKHWCTNRCCSSQGMQSSINILMLPKNCVCLYLIKMENYDFLIIENLYCC